MSDFPHMEEVEGKFYVDTGHADVGPFDTNVEAQEHIDRIRRDDSDPINNPEYFGNPVPDANGVI